MATNSKVSGCIIISIEYKKGGYTLDQAVDRFKTFGHAEMLQENTSEACLVTMLFPQHKTRRLEKNNEPDIAG